MYFTISFAILSYMSFAIKPIELKPLISPVAISLPVALSNMANLMVIETSPNLIPPPSYEISELGLNSATSPKTIIVSEAGMLVI